MWNTPVSSAGGVLKVMEKDLFSSSLASHMRGVPLVSWRRT